VDNPRPRYFAVSVWSPPLFRVSCVDASNCGEPPFVPEPQFTEIGPAISVVPSKQKLCQWVSLLLALEIARHIEIKRCADER